jgi:hypothetical protein
VSEEGGNRARRRWIGYAAAWLAAAALAVVVGVFAVSSVGASVRDRGPLGNDVQRFVDRDGRPTVPAPGATRVRDSIRGAFGSFTVECRGVVAYGLSTTTRDGWRTISYEPGPDDDVDAVFARGRRSVEIEVYCNQGRPTLGDRDFDRLVDGVDADD